MIAKTAIFLSAALAVTTLASAQELEFEGLPGVTAQKPLNGPKKNCVSEWVESPNSILATRVYRCTEGDLSVSGSTPPSPQRINPDPYIHGEADLANPKSSIYTP